VFNLFERVSLVQITTAHARQQRVNALVGYGFTEEEAQEWDNRWNREVIYPRSYALFKKSFFERGE
jgi:hypothetical protein